MTEYDWPLMKDTLTLCDRWKLAKFILTQSKLTQGPMVEQFEDEWSKWLGCKHSLFVTSGSTANFLLLAAIKELHNLPNGTKVLVPACTWVTNINPVFQLGFTPIFCDVNLINFSFDTVHMAKLYKKHPDIKIVFTTHLLGMPAPVITYKDIIPNAIYLDDVCESHGCLAPNYDKVGANSVGATFSFYFGHHMSTVEGGMVCTNDSTLYDLMKLKRSHGLSRFSCNHSSYINMYPDIEPSFLFTTDGYNFRNTELGAVLGLSQLKRLDSFISIRQKRFDEFCTIMRKHTNKFYPIFYNKLTSSFCFPLIAKEPETKKKLTNLLKQYRIEYRPVVAGNLLRQPYLKNKYDLTEDYKNADILHSNGIYVGNNQFVTEKDIKLLDKILGEL